MATYNNAHSATNWMEQDLYGSSRLGMWQPAVKLGTDSSYIKWDTVGKKVYELTNHLDNVLATITDKRLGTGTGTTVSYFKPDVATEQEYYPFGGLMPGRTYTQVGSYRYGFNGKENDNDVKGTGDQQDYGERIYDTRVGRFLSVDPLTTKYPYYTPYSFAGNKPIVFIDRDGEEEGWDNAIDRQQNTLIGGTTKFTSQQIRDGQHARAVGGVIGVVIVTDAFLTKGRLSQFLLTSTFLSAFHDNRAKTPEGRKEQDKQSWNSIANAGMMWGSGEMIGKSFDVMGSILEDASKSLIELTQKRIIVTFQPGRLYTGIPLPQLKITTVINNAGSTVERGLVANEDQLLQVAEHYMSEMKDVKEIEGKPGWYEGHLMDGSLRRIEWQPGGEPVMGEGPHVKVVDYKLKPNGKLKGNVTAKYFIEGNETSK